ncbi:glycosyltransferase family 4 protein [Roseivivax sediminis]|uniref:Glycosyl transferases group 1 n=1 Tax=Roseivivax sediminis TaxID=936889 RepID=A0A1I2B3Z1_9RHOB|nr:glycosyltransferase family 1 protein [Roseivivax sediminis]SFE50796.1 Glycosyl transferases group 1 [Roseivivax sediminis]
MPGAGTARAGSLAERQRLLDLTRLVSRAGRRPTGVDRVELAYLQHLPAPWALVRTALGFLLLDPEGAAAARTLIEIGTWPPPGPLARLARRGDPARAGLEGALRRLAIGRARHSGLGALLRRHVPGGTYVNVGHTALADTLLSGLAAADMRVAVMVHDTIPLDWPDHQRPGASERFAAFLARAGQNADLVIANSAATAADIARHLDHPPPETVVAHLGVPRPVPGEAPHGPWTGTPYVATIGTIEPRKNHAFLLDLWERMGTTAPPLLVLGARGWENHATFARLDAQPHRVHELNDLGDAEMFGLLQESAGLLFPSLAEGYGLPLLEAAHLNVPVICNDLRVFREIAPSFPIYASICDDYLWEHSIKGLVERAATRNTGTSEAPAGIAPPGWNDHFRTVLPRL